MGSNINTNTLQVHTVDTTQLILGDTSVSNISNDYTESDIRKLTTAKALSDAYTTIKAEVAKIENASNLYTDTSALTPSIMSYTMENRRVDTKTGYEIEGFETTGVDRVYTRTTDNANNYIRIPNVNIKYAGMHIFIISITSIDAGTSLTVENNDGVVFATITTPGIHVVEAVVENVNVCTFSIIAHTVNLGDKIVIGRMHFHRVTDRLHLYLLHKLNEVISDIAEVGYITAEVMDQAHAAILSQMTDLLNGQWSQVDSAFQAHIARRNPHGIHPDMIEAARAVHTHLPTECGAAAVSHTHTPNEIGAATSTHSHTPESIGAASTLHNHDNRYLLKTDLVVPKLIKASIVIEAPTGILPVNLSHTQVNPPACILQANRLTHNAIGPIDISSGIITSNRLTQSSLREMTWSDAVDYINANIINAAEPVDAELVMIEFLNPFEGEEVVQATYDTTITEMAEGSQLHDAVRPGTYAIFSESEYVDYVPVILNYTFQIPRKIQDVILTHGTEVSGYPTEVAIYINDVLRITTSITWVNDEAIIPLQSSNTEISKVGLKFNTLSEMVPWSIGFDFIFSDTSTSNFIITKGTRCTYEKDLSISLSQNLTDHVPFSIPDMEIDHPYFIALAMEGESQVVHVASIPPEYGVVNTGTKPFLNAYIDGPTNTFYGTITATSENPQYPVENIYQPDTLSYHTEPSVTSTTITHTFNRLQSVMSLGIRFNKSELAYIPRHIVVSATIEGGNSIELINIVDYVPDINNTDDTYVMISVLVNTDITSLSILMENPIGSEVRLAILEISLGTEFYNISKLLWDDESQRNYVGVIYKRQSGLYDLRSYPIGDSACLPINSLNPTKSNTTYEIVNPYGGKRIGLELISLDETNTSPLGPAAEVVDVTNDKIVIKSIVGSIFAINVVRNW